MSLERFHQAQSSPHAGYTTALAEIRGGGKRSHWIWYIFPQLAGLGQSTMAQTYAIRDFDEACAYLRDPVLRSRYTEIAQTVADQLTRGVPVETLMGSAIDARKLASSLTLFRAVAQHLAAAEPAPGYETLAQLCDSLLTHTTRAGHPTCTFTLQQLTT